MRFKLYLIEMAVDDALKVLSLTHDDLGDKDKIKKAYRRASLANHPDKGGSKEKMQNVNDAYTTLIKTKGGISKVDWEARKQKEKQMAIAVKTALLSSFKPEIFVIFFNDLSGQKFNYEITKTFPEDTKFASYGSAGFKAEFFNPDRSIVFELDVYAFMHDVDTKKAVLGFGDISFELTTTTYAFANNKRHKFGKTEWGSTNRHSFLEKPEKIFPTNKVKKILSGESRGKSKFSKRDMHTFLMKKLNADQPFTDKGMYTIPLDKEGQYYLSVRRSVFMKTASWSPWKIYEKSGKYRYVPVEGGVTRMVTLPETEETAKEFDMLVKELRKKKDPKQMTDFTNRWIKEQRKKRDY